VSALALQVVSVLQADGVGSIVHNSPLSNTAKYSTCHTIASDDEVVNKDAYLEIF
jgi:hypothetical protein